jgi:hypothetical protein
MELCVLRFEDFFLSKIGGGISFYSFFCMYRAVYRCKLKQHKTKAKLYEPYKLKDKTK